MATIRKFEPPYPLPWKWIHNRRWELVDANEVELIVAMGHTTSPPEVSVDKLTRDYLVRCANVAPAMLDVLEQGTATSSFAAALRRLAQTIEVVLAIENDAIPPTWADWLRSKADEIDAVVKAAKERV